mgnify:CR=1 FL=1
MHQPWINITQILNDRNFLVENNQFYNRTECHRNNRGMLLEAEDPYEDDEVLFRCLPSILNNFDPDTTKI